MKNKRLRKSRVRAEILMPLDLEITGFLIRATLDSDAIGVSNRELVEVVSVRTFEPFSTPYFCEALSLHLG